MKPFPLFAPFVVSLVVPRSRQSSLNLRSPMKVYNDGGPREEPPIISLVHVI